MTAIIRRFLDSARALVPRPEPVQLGALVDEALSLNVSAEARHRIEVRREVPADLGPASIDPSLVRHVLGNFISNAVDAMPAGGSLTVRARRAGDQLALSVTDTGGGIAPDARKHIFEPFFTTKEAGKGTGLGLAISREIAGALRGRIEVESEPGRRRHLHPPLPRAALPPPPPPIDRIRPWTTPPASWWWTTTSRAGSCSPASSPRPDTASPRSPTAGRRWRRSTPATRPTSWSPTSAWPRWTGFRSSTPSGSARPDTPVILVTAFGNIDGAVEAIRRGAADYLSKPYDVDAIQLVVARALQHRALAMENRALRRGLRDRYRLENVVGRSEAMLQVYKTAARVASTDATVLIQGESGTGKELVARAIHTALAAGLRPVRGRGLRRHRRGRARVASSSATPAAPSPAPRRRGAASSRRPTAAPSSSTRLATSAPNLQARLLRALQEGDHPPRRRERAHRASTCASSPPPTATWRRR